SRRDYSEDVAGTVDDEVRKLIEEGHDEAWEVITEYRDVLDELVLRLLDKETLNQQELAEVFATVKKRPPRNVWLSSDQRHVSDRGPVLTPSERKMEEEALREVEAPALTQVEAANRAAEVAAAAGVEGEEAIGVVPDNDPRDAAGVPITPAGFDTGFDGVYGGGDGTLVPRGTTEVIYPVGDEPKAEPEFPDGAGYPYDLIPPTSSSGQGGPARNPYAPPPER
ncbi:MAG: hypothetical protein LBB58_01895, partial [Cellulomonadaceae bacterium]|nr:hypothetical protein [Cellulomonadaceae bacterium]